MTLIAIDNVPVAASWGARGGISALLGRPPTDAQQAELWLGAHPRSPSQVIEPAAPWPDLLAWEEDTGQRLPFLLKILDAAAPLSIQAHPAAQQARRGYQREDEAGIPLGADHRNYRDPWAKPEMIVALAGEFEALCGFREPSEVVAMIGRIRTALDSAGMADQALLRWAERLVSEDLGDVVGWLLSGVPEVAGLITELSSAAALCPDELALVPRLLADYPRDPGVAVALLLNHEVLAPGEALWLPAGTVHAYLRGTGMELMGPSDNVLRGGLTEKHVDVDELLAVFDSAAGPATRLDPVTCGPGVRSYRTAQGPEKQGAAFELVEITNDAAVLTTGPSLIAVLEGAFVVREPQSDDRRDVSLGGFFLQTSGGALELMGSGKAFIATLRSA